MAYLIGGVIFSYSNMNACQTVDYVCEDYGSTNVSITVSDKFSNSPVMVYMGLSGFYSAYLALRSSFSSTQIQAEPRSAAFIPYSGCSPVDSLSDLKGVVNPYVAIDAFATDPNWRDHFNLTEVNTSTLRPCGALFYWIPTDTFTVYSSSGEEILQSTDNLSWDELNIPAEPVGQTFPYIDPITKEFVWADPSTQRFRAWMRSNIGPEFLLKTGEFQSGIPQGDYTISINQCRSLDADKFVRICTTTWIGVHQVFLAAMYFACGSILIAAMVAFLVMGKLRRFA